MEEEGGNKTVYHFVNSNLRIEISPKKERLTKKAGEFWKLFCLGGEKMTYFGEGRVCLRD